MKEGGGAMKEGGGAVKEGSGTMKGLVSCIGGVGGVSITIWLLFFVFLEPYDPSINQIRHYYYTTRGI